MGDIWGWLIYVKTYISYNKSYIIPVSIWLIALAYILNGYEISFNTTNILFHMGFGPRCWICFGHVVYPLWMYIELLTGVLYKSIYINWSEQKVLKLVWMSEFQVENEMLCTLGGIFYRIITKYESHFVI